MRLLKLAAAAAAAAIAFGTMAGIAIPPPGASAEAQRHWRGDGHRWHGRHWCGDGHRHWRLGGRHCARRTGWRGRDLYRTRRPAVCHEVWRDGRVIPVCRY